MAPKGFVTCSEHLAGHKNHGKNTGGLAPDPKLSTVVHTFLGH